MIIPNEPSFTSVLSYGSLQKVLQCIGNIIFTEPTSVPVGPYTGRETVVNVFTSVSCTIML